MGKSMKTEAAKHAPLPWPDPDYDNDVGPNDEGFWEFWRVAGVADFTNEADARLAVRAVNSHEQLLAACRSAEQFIYADAINAHLGEMLKQLRDAIAKAEGRS